MVDLHCGNDTKGGYVLLNNDVLLHSKNNYFMIQ